ncbi:MAG: YCF48-related protein [Rugosibacter sp.]|nr:YCF48-related protein [Rugosibacter sp.]
MKKKLIFALAWLSCALSCTFATFAIAQIQQATIVDIPVPAKLVPKAIHARFMAIAINHEGGMLAVGERGIIVHSADHGTTWKQMPSPVDITLASVNFETSQRVWAVGQAASILRSDDGGKTWKVVRYKPSDLRYYLKIVIREGVLYVLSSDGELWLSRDSGANWEMALLENGEAIPHLFSLAFVGQAGLISAEHGSVFMRGKNDEPWKPLAIAYNGSFFGVVPFADQFLLFGMSGRVFMVSPDGKSQRVIDTRTTQFLLDAVVIPEKNQAVVVGRGGAVILIGADSQVLKSYQRPDGTDITAVAARGDDIYLATMKGGIERFKASDLAKSTGELQPATTLSPAVISK